MEYLSVKEAAIRLGVHPDTIRRAINSGRLPAYTVASRVRIRASDLDEWIAPRKPAA